MAASIEHRSVSAWPSHTVYEALTSADYLRERLDALGGPGAAVVSWNTDADIVRYVLRHGVDERRVPGLIRRLVPTPLAVHREETWTRRDPGHYTGSVVVTVEGVPGALSGATTLRPAGAGGSELVLTGTATVRLPVAGGQVERMVVGQVRTLLEAEAAFTEDWLTRSP